MLENIFPIHEYVSPIEINFASQILINLFRSFQGYRLRHQILNK